MSALEKAVVILAGGLGTRLRPATGEIPKVMAPINGRPFLELLLRDLKSNGYQQVILSLGYGADAVEGYLHSAGWSDSFARPVREAQPLGTGGALLHVLRETGLPGPVTVANGDTWIDGAWKQLARLSPRSAAIGVARVSDTRRFGQVALSESGDQVLSFREKSQEKGAGLIYSGIAVLSAADLGSPASPVFSLEREVLPRLAAAGQLRAFFLDGRFTDIGVPEDYQAFCASRGK